MINLFAILFSTGMVMYIVLRAARMDRVRPWFETRSLYELELKREQTERQAAQAAAKGKIALGRRSGIFAEPLKRAPAAAGATSRR